jgi:hypothetical protein
VLDISFNGFPHLLSANGRTGGTLLWPEIRREGYKFLASAREANQFHFEVTRDDFPLNNPSLLARSFSTL